MHIVIPHCVCAMAEQFLSSCHAVMTQKNFQPMRDAGTTPVLGYIHASELVASWRSQKRVAHIFALCIAATWPIDRNSVHKNMNSLHTRVVAPRARTFVGPQRPTNSAQTLHMATERSEDRQEPAITVSMPRRNLVAALLAGPLLLPQVRVLAHPLKCMRLFHLRKITRILCSLEIHRRRCCRLSWDTLVRSVCCCSVF